MKFLSGLWKFIRRRLNNLNWSKRDADIWSVEANYRRILDLPRKTNNAISPERFWQLQAEHDVYVSEMIDKYGSYWRSYLERYAFRD